MNNATLWFLFCHLRMHNLRNPGSGEELFILLLPESQKPNQVFVPKRPTWSQKKNTRLAVDDDEPTRREQNRHAAKRDREKRRVSVQARRPRYFSNPVKTIIVRSAVVGRSAETNAHRYFSGDNFTLDFFFFLYFFTLITSSCRSC